MGSEATATFVVQGKADGSVNAAIDQVATSFARLEQFAGKRITYGLEDLGKAVGDGSGVEQVQGRITGMARAIDEAKQKARDLADPAAVAAFNAEIAKAERELAALGSRAQANDVARGLAEAEKAAAKLDERIARGAGVKDVKDDVAGLSASLKAAEQAAANVTDPKAAKEFQQRITATGERLKAMTAGARLNDLADGMRRTADAARSITNNLAGMAGMNIAGGVFSFLGQAIGVAADRSGLLGSLAVSMNAIGDAGGRSEGSLKSFARSLAELSGYGTDEILGVLKQARQGGADGRQMEEIAKAAVAVSRVYGQDLGPSAAAIIELTKGEIGAIQRLVPEFNRYASSAAIMAEINRRGGQMMGAAADGSKGYAAAMQRAKDAAADLMDEVGQAMLPVLQELAPTIRAAIPDIAALAKALGEVLAVAVKTAGALLKVGKVAGDAMGGRTARFAGQAVGELMAEADEKGAAAGYMYAAAQEFANGKTKDSIALSRQKYALRNAEFSDMTGIARDLALQALRVDGGKFGSLSDVARTQAGQSLVNSTQGESTLPVLSEMRDMMAQFRQMWGLQAAHPGS